MNTRKQLWILAAACVSGWSSAAFAQNALGGGNALDAGLSLQRGGRINSQTQDLQAIIRYNNAVGAASASGRLFAQPGTVGGRLSGSGLYATGVEGFGGVYYSREARGFVSSTGAGTSGFVPGAASSRLSDSTREDRRLRDYVASPGRSLSFPRGYSASNDFRAPSETLVGYGRDAAGAEVEARASALRGLTFAPLEKVGPDNRLDYRVTPSPSSTIMDRRPGAEDVDPRLSARPVLPSPLEQARKSYGEALKGATKRADSRNVAERSDDRVIDPRDRDKTPAERAIEADLRTKKNAGTDAEAALARLRKKLGAGAAPVLRGADSPMTGPAKETDGAKSAAAAGVGVVSPSVEAAATEDDIAALRAMNLKLETLVPPGASMDQAYTGYMSLGQESLGTGRYGQAEMLFDQALSVRRNDPMARIGKVHSALGMGLISSPAVILSNIFADHPELIAAKYDASLMMPINRAEIIAGMLLSEVKKGDESLTANEAPLLLAYLGRHFDRREWLDAGLEGLVKRAAKDASVRELNDLVVKVWSTK